MGEAAHDSISTQASADVLREYLRLRASGALPGATASDRERLVFMAACSILELERHDREELTTADQARSSTMALPPLAETRAGMNPSVRAALVAAKAWINILVEQFDLEPADTSFNVKAVSPTTGDKHLAKVTLAQTLGQIDLAIAEGTG